ncbi:MAG: hypothetical protein D3923_04670 [Candidatus Electrothrix sp. AR3]|nr:hypothetical protein [Candidatus Electrothrix sp. AR3]
MEGADLPPAPPSNVSATKGTYADKVGVIWSSVSGADSYKAYRCASTATATCSEIYSGGALTYDDVDAADDDIQYYWVKACSNDFGCGEYSRSSMGYKEGVTPPPSNFPLPAIMLLLN